MSKKNLRFWQLKEVAYVVRIMTRKANKNKKPRVEYLMFTPT